MYIRTLAFHDQKAVEKMDTGIPHDYVKEKFLYLLCHDHLFGAFSGDELISIAGYTVFAEQYAMLGRLRTAAAYRGRGIGTIMMEYVQTKALEQPAVQWTGFITQVTNKQTIKIAQTLMLEPVQTQYYGYLTAAGEKALSQRTSSRHEWEKVMDNNKKRQLLQRTANDYDRTRVFPYNIYCPLPFEESLWSDRYLDQCQCYQSGSRLFLLMKDDRIGSYYHVKYFWNDVFEQHGLWSIVTNQAALSHRRIWLDLTPSSARSLPDVSYVKVDTPWTLFGRHFS
ncbi:Acetyltransferase (GNAT) family protein [Alteribacillus persepolensis]|uniref:Acetyltransferase (GNAT) family protein n=1 Tax=Alteribacillus persepolensis TaxID=568899 RepID=A0A1G7Z3G8_9BACI|nr:GNAT family N-acetyltransferase [Alteribacillus persepolensis]SDH03263.1 Acetyltransferase (GNAT) family protein [Alteribacillus persepolensis]